MRILIVEDEYLVASMLDDFLQNIGISVVGPAYTIEDGLQLSQDEMLHGAILDVNVRGARIDPIADMLSSRAIPFALATGYSGSILDRWQHCPVLSKPYTKIDVANVIEEFRGRV
jgi:DNA-binding NarL/FixJ family response regulator